MSHWSKGCDLLTQIEIEFCPILVLSNPFLYSVRSNNLNLKYQRSRPLGGKDRGIGKFEYLIKILKILIKSTQSTLKFYTLRITQCVRFLLK